MEVILSENFVGLGFVGDTVRVRRGYARNFLIPRGIAVEAGSSNANILKSKIQAINAKKAKLKKEAEEVKSKLEGLLLEFSLKAGSKGKSFGTLTNRDMEAALKEKEIVIDRRLISLSETIKSAGQYQVTVKLHSEVVASIPVKVVTISEAKSEVDEEKKTSRKSSKKKGKKEEVQAVEEAGEAVEEPK